MNALFEKIEGDIGAVEVVVFNIGANVMFSITETTARVYQKVWEMAAFAGFLTVRDAAKVMLSRNKSTIIFTGATASLRGASGFSAFASAKFALRALSQSIAREFGPQGIHVAHSIIDGAIDIAFIKDNFPDKYATKAQAGILDPEYIAEQYWQIHCQPKYCWTHELDPRPWQETF
jgi:NAD(P)-dependent dehydrogenase (short-subunit alcohol dehydrogenase family)